MQNTDHKTGPNPTLIDKCTGSLKFHGRTQDWNNDSTFLLAERLVKGMQFSTFTHSLETPTTKDAMTSGERKTIKLPRFGKTRIERREFRLAVQGSYKPRQQALVFRRILTDARHFLHSAPLAYIGIH